MPVRPSRNLAAALLLAAVLVVGLPAPARAEAGGAYRPPVDGPVTDPFRPPVGFGPGNRGIDFATEPGTPVTAAAAGEITFAGLVGRSRHVVVLHPDGLRTSYSFLATVDVRRGDRVEQGQTLGTAGGSVHFGARARCRLEDYRLDRAVRPRNGGWTWGRASSQTTPRGGVLGRPRTHRSETGGPHVHDDD